MAELRHLILVLGDQLDLQAAAFDGFDPACDAVWMAEVMEESTHVASSQPRIALFLSAMRHFAQALAKAGRPLHYRRLDEPGQAHSLGEQLQADVQRLRPRGLVMTAPGDWRVLKQIQAAATALQRPLEVREDRHFWVSVREFAAYAKGRSTLRMEYFYREQRRRHRVLMTPEGDSPEGGQWNFDSDNRKAFGAEGPGLLPSRAHVEPDPLTREVLDLVRQRFAHHPGRLDHFAWPVTREQALQALKTFIEERLPLFGPYQDAIWPDQPWLYHAHLSAALNLKLLNPREVVWAAEAAYREGRAGLASVEGFVRQILGWREYVRGIYWSQGPDYGRSNALGATLPLPSFYWDGETDMNCLRSAIGDTLKHAYSHHIQRLMITGNFALLAGIHPAEIAEWYLAVYADAIEWVELPNTHGMAMFADGGLLASKPYAASGAYINRMSDFCRGCAYDARERTGPRACPFNFLYWAFLLRNQKTLRGNPRMAMAYRTLAAWPLEERRAVAARAGAFLAALRRT